MKVLMVEPGYAPYEKELNGLEEMQAAVGGLIQAIYPFEEQVAVVCNDEGLINGMEFNRSVPGGYEGVFGPFFVCGIEGENFCSLTPEQIKTYQERFYRAEILLAVNRVGYSILAVQPKIKPGQEQESNQESEWGMEPKADQRQKQTRHRKVKSGHER